MGADKVEIHLYGMLRHYSKDFIPTRDVVLMVDLNPDETVGTMLVRVGIPVEEINHIFFNSKLLASRALMAPLYGLPQVDTSVSDWNLNVPVDSGDRIGLFGIDIPSMGM